MDEFLVKDYSNVSKKDTENKDFSKVEYHVVTFKEMLEWLDKAKNDSALQISVYEIGDCLLDWS